MDCVIHRDIRIHGKSRRMVPSRRTTSVVPVCLFVGKTSVDSTPFVPVW